MALVSSCHCQMSLSNGSRNGPAHCRQRSNRWWDLGILCNAELAKDLGWPFSTSWLKKQVPARRAKNNKCLRACACQLISVIHAWRVWPRVERIGFFRIHSSIANLLSRREVRNVPLTTNNPYKEAATSTIFLTTLLTILTILTTLARTGTVLKS